MFLLGEFGFGHRSVVGKLNERSPLTLILSPQTGRGDTPSPARAGEGWGEGGHAIWSKSVLFAKRMLLVFFAMGMLFGWSLLAMARPTIEELKARAVLDDYESNVVFGYNIVMETNRYAGRYAGSRLSCTSCHLKGGTQPNGFPLNVAGVYPKWRSKNGVRNGIGLRIRDCFMYSLNGVMPPEEAPEVQAVAAYIHYLSEGEVIGRPPVGFGVPTLPETGC